MFNNTGESKMKEENTKVFLVIKKTTWQDGETWFDVSEHSSSRARAENCMVALNTLNQENKVSYLICEVANDNK